MKYLIALLTAATGLLHILVGFGWLAGGGDGTNWILILNGVGYLVLLALYWMAGGSRGMIRWILLVYTLITLVGYFIIGAGFNGGTIPLVIKAIELLLIILLFLDRGSDRVAVRPAAPTASRAGAPTTTTTSYAGTRTVSAPEADAAVTGMAATSAAGIPSAAAGAAAAVAAMDARADDSMDRAMAASGEVGNVVEEGVEDAGYLTTDVSERVGTVVDTVEAETAGAYDAVSDTAGGMVDAAGDAVDALGDKAAEVYDAVADTTSDAVDYVGDKAEDAMDAAGDAVDALGDKAAEAYDAVADTTSDAVDYVGDKAEDAMDAKGDAFNGGMATIGATMGAVGGRLRDDADTVDEAMDDLDDAARGSLITGSAAVDSIDTRLGDQSGGMVIGDAAAMDAADLAAEPSAEQLRAELEDYLRSFGSGSEFRKEIEYVEGIGAVYGQKLRAVGISTVLDLMVNGATRRGRKHIADQTGIAPSSILTWVNHVDLFRIKGIAQEYADLLEQSGVDTVVELAQRNPSNLHKRMVDINEQKKLVRRLPHASEVQSWVQQAKDLRRVIHY